MKTPLIPTVSWRAVLCAAAATCATSLFAQAATDTSSTASSSADSAVSAEAHPLKHTDRTFVEKAAEAGREEVAISKVAAERATNPDVRQFARMMVDDHSRANDELASLAASKNVKLKDHDDHADKWTKKDAKDFDRDYVERMVADHKKAIKLFSHESTDGSDADLVEFARKTLPTLNKHLERVNELEKTVK